ncbi:Monoamine oxidase [Klebsiella grimontii]|uniref:Monoamine oxidase n=1 Tax=Klebsiella grimontii TaxID=2058152 RepID=A0A7H4P4K7_9ENTR|nr:Monoamine oxidase [Klebsiella grimontii]
MDDVVWITTGTTHVARAEEWPIYAYRVGACAAEAVELL